MTSHALATAIDIGDLLDAAGWSRYQKWVLAMAALAFCVDGLANQILSNAIPELMAAWSLSQEAFSLPVASGLFGVAIGTVAGGWLGDRFGRRIGLTGSLSLFGAATVGIALVDGINMLTLLRLADGLGIGAAIPNGAALIAEYTPSRRRSRAIAIGMVFIPVGMFCAGVLSSIVLPVWGWQTLFAVTGAIALLTAAALAALLPESPRFLARRPRRRRELHAVLARIGHPNPAELCITEPAESAAAPVAVLWAQPNRRTTFGIWGAFFFCLLASYMMFNWIPSMLAALEFGTVLRNVAVSAFHLGGIIGGLSCGFLIERYGSRATVTALAAGGITAALALGVVLSLPTAAGGLVLVFFVVEGFFVAGIHNIVYTMAASAYPPIVKATGIGLAAGIGRIGAILSSFAGPWALDLGGSAGYFAVIVVLLGCCLACALAVPQHVPRAGAESARA